MQDTDTAALEAFLAAHAPITPKAAFREGERIGDWRITAFLGKGSGGEVYRAERIATPSVAAIKVHVPRPDKSAAQQEIAKQRFLREAQILSESHYPFFPRFYGEGEARGYPYFAMELLEPVTLPSTDRDVADFLLHTAIAVRTLHHNGLVHRDIKPQNIMRRENGELVLIDLGLVKAASTMQSPAGSSVTMVDGKPVGAGTPRYAAPEQFIGGEISFATDIHALGMMANECFGGNPPRDWERIISRATSSIPERRYADANALIAAIRRRHWGRFAWAGGILLTVALAVIMVGGDFQAPRMVGRSVPERRTSEQAPRSPLTESKLWKSIAENVMTNDVSKELVYERIGTNSWGRAQSDTRAYRNVTNNVPGTIIRLDGKTHVFKEPLALDPGRHYWIVGPGTLDVALEGASSGGEVIVHLDNCVLINRTIIPIKENHIRYVFSKGSYLNFINREPGESWHPYVEDFDGAYNAIEFQGPETLKELLRRRHDEIRAMLREP